MAAGAITLVLVAVLGVALQQHAHATGSPAAAIEQARVADATVPAAPNPMFPLVGLVGSAWIPIRAARHRRRILAAGTGGSDTVGESRWRALLLGAPPLAIG